MKVIDGYDVMVFTDNVEKNVQTVHSDWIILLGRKFSGKLSSRYASVPTVGYNQSQAYRRFTSRLFRRRKIADVINDLFESVHNYISDDNIIPKGAISARKGEKCIILYGG